MKKQNGILRLSLCSLLVSMLMLASVPAMAAESDPNYQVVVSTTAGMQGCYMYDMETGVETYLPPLTSVEHNRVIPATGEFKEEPVTPRGVIGEDTRSIVSNPAGPTASICLLGSRAGDGKDDVGIGTGWLINKNHIVTAGHCLYDDRWGTSNSEDKHMPSMLPSTWAHLAESSAIIGLQRPSMPQPITAKIAVVRHIPNVANSTTGG